MVLQPIAQDCGLCSGLERIAREVREQNDIITSWHAYNTADISVMGGPGVET